MHERHWEYYCAGYCELLYLYTWCALSMVTHVNRPLCTRAFTANQKQLKQKSHFESIFFCICENICLWAIQLGVVSLQNAIVLLYWTHDSDITGQSYYIGRNTVFSSTNAHIMINKASTINKVVTNELFKRAFSGPKFH